MAAAKRNTQFRNLSQFSSIRMLEAAQKYRKLGLAVGSPEI
jgi:hypothetical protein